MKYIKYLSIIQITFILFRNNVLKPMLVVKSGYEVGKGAKKSNNKVLLTSTADHRANWLYGVYVKWTKAMLDGDKDYFSMTLPYTVGVRAGLYDEKVIEDARLTMASSEFEREYLGRFNRLIDGSWIRFDDIMACSDLNVIETKGVGKFEYIMAVDVARIKDQDNTIMMVFKLRWYKNRVEADLVYIRSLNGAKFEEQASNLRELLRKFPNTIRIYMDSMTIGQGLADELAKDYYCDVDEKWYPPLIDMNDETAMRNIDKTKGVPIIYGIKATPEINHRMGYAVKTYTEKHWLHMYPLDASEEAYMKKGQEYTFEEELLLRESQEVRTETLNIENIGMAGNWLRFGTRSKRKDRWTALGMGLYGATLIKQERDFNDETDEMIAAVSFRR